MDAICASMSFGCHPYRSASLIFSFLRSGPATHFHILRSSEQKTNGQTQVHVHQGLGSGVLNYVLAYQHTLGTLSAGLTPKHRRAADGMCQPVSCTQTQCTGLAQPRADMTCADL